MVLYYIFSSKQTHAQIQQQKTLEITEDHPKENIFG